MLALPAHRCLHSPQADACSQCKLLSATLQSLGVSIAVIETRRLLHQLDAGGSTKAFEHGRTLQVLQKAKSPSFISLSSGNAEKLGCNTRRAYSRGGAPDSIISALASASYVIRRRWRTVARMALRMPDVPGDHALWVDDLVHGRPNIVTASCRSCRSCRSCQTLPLSHEPKQLTVECGLSD